MPGSESERSTRGPRLAQGRPADPGGGGVAQRNVLIGSTVFGFLGMVMVVGGVAEPGSSFTSKLPGSWVFGLPHSSPGARGSEWYGLVLFYSGTIVLLTAWYLLITACARRPGTSVRPFYWIAALWVTPLLIAPPLLSRDVYTYAAEGQLVSHGGNPYRQGLLSLRGTTFFDLSDPLWHSTHAPYGPIFFDLARVNTALWGNSVLANIEGYRLMAVLGVALIAWSAPALARSLGQDASTGLVLAVLNPVVLLYLIGGAHNDALMLGLLVAGITLALTGRPLLGVVLCALGAAIKVPAALGFVYVGWIWAGANPSVNRRLKFVAGSLGVGAACLAVITALSGLGWGWIVNLSDPGEVTSWLDPASAAGLSAFHLFHLFGTTVGAPTFVSGSRAGALLIAAVVVVVLVVNTDRLGVARSMGWSLLAVVLLGPIVWPWYETWGLVVLAFAVDRWSRRVVVALATLGTFATFPSGLSLSTGDVILTTAILLGVAGVALTALTHLRRRLAVQPGLPSAAGRATGSVSVP
jgi:alpha-1,6-mannosyltransferase